MQNFANVVNIVVGDWSNDGHGHTDTITLLSNISKNDIDAAYRAGVNIIGVDLMGKFCRDYEDDKVADTIVSDVEAKGLKFSEIAHANECDLDGNYWRMSPGSWSVLYLAIVQLGNPAFKYELVKGQEIRIGGYGLFWG
jgi:hypothetical protein